MNHQIQTRHLVVVCYICVIYIYIYTASLGQIMPCRSVPISPHRYLVNKTPVNFKTEYSNFHLKNEFENVVCKMATILSWPR